MRVFWVFEDLYDLNMAVKVKKTPFENDLIEFSDQKIQIQPHYSILIFLIE